jgi:transcriptional regulator with XRE-family HTH domain
MSYFLWFYTSSIQERERCMNPVAAVVRANVSVSDGYSTLAEAPFSEQVKLLRTLFQLTQAELAQCLSVDVKTIQRWEAGESKKSPNPRNQQTVAALVTIAETLGDLLESDSIPTWARSINPSLGDKTPMQFVKEEPGGLYILANKLGAVGR